MSTETFISTLTGNSPISSLVGLSSAVPRGVKNQLCIKAPERLQALREAQQLSRRTLSTRAGLAVTAASDFEAGRVPGIDTVEHLATALGVPPWWVAFGPEGTEPFKERRPRDVLPPDPPAPEEHWRLYRARYEGCAARVREAREASGLSMRQLSDAAGISVQAWSNTEAGKTVPKVDSLERMAVALGVAPAWLAYGYEDRE